MVADFFAGEFPRADAAAAMTPTSAIASAIATVLRDSALMFLPLSVLAHVVVSRFGSPLNNDYRALLVRDAGGVEQPQHVDRLARVDWRRNALSETSGHSFVERSVRSPLGRDLAKVSVHPETTPELP